MQPIGRRTRTSGKWTGLGIAQQFSNAAVHFLREHSLAKSHKSGGTELPIDQGVWGDILDEEFGRNVGQTLAAYCKCYNDGVHGHGYDRDGTWDCGTGNRAVEQVKGRSINGTKLSVHPGSRSYLKPLQVIRIVRRRLAEIPTRQGRAVANRLERQSRILEVQGYFDPKDNQDARERIETEIVRRRGKDKFRAELLDAYRGRCAVTRCLVVEALESAHIKPYKGPKTNHVTNGLLLRGDIHTLFDLNLLGIEPESLKLRLAPKLRGSSYEKYNGRVLRQPRDESQRPNTLALHQKWNEFQRAVSSSHG